MLRTYIEWLTELPWNASSEDMLDIEAARTDPRRGPLRSRAHQGPHPRLPGGAQAARRRARADPVLPRAARRRQDVARAIDRAGAWGASSCACRWAACATRPRSAATGAPTSARCPGRIIQALKQAGTNNPVLLLDEVDKLGADVPRRSVGGAAGGAGPRAEPHLPRSLPGRAVRPVEGAVHRDGEPARDHPGAAARPHGDAAPVAATARKRSWSSPSATWCRSRSARRA